MGQHFMIIFLENSESVKVLCWLYPMRAKLTEHSFFDDNERSCLTRVESYLIPGSPFHKTPLLWAGAYADVEEKAEFKGWNMFSIALDGHPLQQDYFQEKLFPSDIAFHNKRRKEPEPIIDQMDWVYFHSRDFPFIANHTLREYVNKYPTKVDKLAKDEEEEEEDYEEAREADVHPLPILTCEGNGRGGGDYRGTNMHLVGRWARHVISLEKEPPEGFAELKCKFIVY